MNLRHFTVSLLAYLLILLSSQLEAENEVRELARDSWPTADGCQVLNVTPQPTEAIHWTGECVGGVVNGKGTIDYGNGNRYEGSFRNGTENGHGTFYAANGDRFEGYFKDGKENGRGTIVFASGASYEGEFKDGKKDGQGKYYWNDGSQFEGRYQQDRRHGQGKYIWADGSQYEGEYRDDKKNGYGVVSWTDGNKYEGSFENGVAVGGKFYFTNGNVALSHQEPNGHWVIGTSDRREYSAKIEEVVQPVLPE